MITLDLVGMAASMLATYYFVVLSKKAWIVTLLATLLNGYLYWRTGIYADACLELFYFSNACYGLYLWSTPTNDRSRIIYQLKAWHWALLCVTITLLFRLLCFLLKAFTASDVVLLDAITTALSIVAQVLMAYKVIHTWLLWAITDTIYGYLYIHKQIPFHALLMFCYLGFAVAGFYRWSQTSKKGQVISTQGQQNPVQ